MLTGYTDTIHLPDRNEKPLCLLNPVDDSAMSSQVNPPDFVQPRSRSFHHWAIVPSRWWCVLTTNTCQLLLDRRLLCRRWHLLSSWPWASRAHGTTSDDSGTRPTTVLAASQMPPQSPWGSYCPLPGRTRKGESRKDCASQCPSIGRYICPFFEVSFRGLVVGTVAGS